ncbi:GNAT family N-acetyltransferase [Oceanibacterium hippocampi]|uniref:Putative acetyltransferase YhhY n=1 Tax=Oceanibacterium hippocampi TaxID=745714 RepID=A0A1Y5RJ02_9PROT|nr:GNAT family N-acetyltransferase [Oceanibacterium hippocampi]SLN18418.1 putative acetyltransferase YhhY [Oceanibacterium hippocampi]
MEHSAVQASIERLTKFSKADLFDICEATEQAIIDGNGFGWLKPPPRESLEKYWKGVLLVPVRELYVARLDGRIVGTGQLVKPYPNNEAGAHIAQVTTFFVAPYARGHGLARGLLHEIELSARAHGYRVLDLDVRASQHAAIALYEGRGFQRWATKAKYARVNGEYVEGYFYSKDLEAS